MRRLAAAALLAVLAPPAAHAWGPTGHRIVGRIAERHLAPETARAVASLIGPESLAQASTWPDEIRSDPAWKRAEPWHFFSIDDGEAFDTTARNPAGDVIEAIGRFAAVLEDPAAPRQQRVEALRFLVHFVGDIHQPLHVGRRADLGGNKIEVTWFGQRSNLHSVWDSGLIDHELLSFSEMAGFLDHPNRAEVIAWQAGDVGDWARESFGSRSQVYDIGDGKLSWEYSYRKLPIVQLRLLQAGVRLAGMLDRVFAAPAAEPGSGRAGGEAGDRRRQVGRVDRLGEVQVVAGGQGEAAVLGTRVGGQGGRGHARGERLAGAQAAHQGVAVLPGHADVGDQHVRPRPLDLGQRLGGRRGHGDPRAIGLQDLAQQVAGVRLVVDHEDREAVQVDGRRARRRLLPVG